VNAKLCAPTDRRAWPITYRCSTVQRYSSKAKPIRKAAKVLTALVYHQWRQHGELQCTRSRWASLACSYRSFGSEVSHSAKPSLGLPRYAADSFPTVPLEFPPPRCTLFRPRRISGTRSTEALGRSRGPEEQEGYSRGYSLEGHSRELCVAQRPTRTNPCDGARANELGVQSWAKVSVHPSARLEYG
jgi:hypothetical protein